MPFFVKLQSLLRNLFRRGKIERDLNQELRSHLQMLADQNLRAGMTPEEAQRAARIELGGMEQVKEQVRDARAGSWLQSPSSDARFALRQFRKAPVFTAVAVLTLALGIGANTALFSVIDAVLLRPLPFQEPDRLVSLNPVDLRDPSGAGDISYPAFLDWRTQNKTFQAMSVYNITSLTYTGGDQPESVRSAVVSANLLSLLGVSPAHGRNFAEQEDQPGDGNAPVLLSYEFWQSHFAGDTEILGKALTLDGTKYAVVGIMPAGFQFPVRTERVELWITIAHDLKGKYAMATQRGAAYLQVIGRLKPGVTLAEAQSDVLLVQTRLNKQYPENRPRGVAAMAEADRIAGDMRRVLWILLGAVGFVLLIACANVASLLLARATVRQKEFSVRLALGASRATILRQLLVESMLLAFIGGLAGLVLARWATGALVSMIPEGLARASGIHLDFRVMGFTLLIALVTGVLFGLAPAIQAGRGRFNEGFAAGGRGASTGPQGTRLRSVLVVSQLAIAFVLLIGAGLLLRSFHRLLHVDPGFQPDHLLTFVLEVPSERHQGQQSAFVDEILEATRALPGVKSAGAIFGLPLSEQDARTALDIEGRPVPRSQRPVVGFCLVESQYFHAMGIPLLQGRIFTAQDERGGPQLAIVNETFARKMFPNENPIGKRIKPNISFGESDDAPMREIVGVVGDVRSGAIDHAESPTVYVPQTPTDFVGEMTIVVRTATQPESIVPTLRSLISSRDKTLPLRRPRTMEEYVSGSISSQRFEALLLSAFATLAFLLTAIGLYGVISYSVAQRTREMGIRIALGAQDRSLFLMVLRHGALLTLAGAAIGLAVSFFAADLLRALLYEIAPLDPITFVAVPMILLGVALLASYLPARRAARVNPVIALHYE